MPLDFNTAEPQRELDQTTLAFLQKEIIDAIGAEAYWGRVEQVEQDAGIQGDDGVALVLQAYDGARAALALCRSTDEVRKILDKSVMLRAYAKQAKDRSLEADAFEIRSRAERRLGEMLRAQKETVGFNEGGRPSTSPETGSAQEPVFCKPPTLAEAGIDKKLSMRAQRLAKLPEAEFDSVIAEGRQRIIEVGRERIQNALANLTGAVEWYTPPTWIERARDAMGSIDCDPASCEHAQRIVRAAEWFDQDRDGLKQTWRGNVWLNPPYSRGLIDQFVEKVIAERAHYSQAIVLVDARSDTEWFHNLCSIASAVAFPKGRIDFYNANVTDRSSPVFGSAFVYIGDRRDAFIDAFGDRCLILQPVGAGGR